MKTRNTNTYRAVLNGFKSFAFGKPIVFNWRPTVEIYQARVSPELWRARPGSGRVDYKWEAATAADLMRIITADFVGLIEPWTEWTRSGACVGLVKRRGGAAGDVEKAS